MRDSVGAFCDHGWGERRTRDDGPLAGLRFAVKDFFDVAGVPTGAGSPDWLASHPAPTRTASVVQRLLDAGATMVGKTHTDELAWSLAGQNAHYGTPINSAAPDRIPGGSSSGSAAATAAGLVDFALGSDTGGSVRLPASFCGVYGIRTSHGAIPLDGAVPLASSYDSAGWFARDPAVFARVGAVLLPPAQAPSRLLMAADLFEQAGPAVAAALQDGVRRVESVLGAATPIHLGATPEWREVFRLIQASEAWAAHGAWVTATRPQFGPGVRERFEAASRLDPAAVAQARVRRSEIAATLRGLMAPGTLLLLPVAPGIAPLRDAGPAETEVFRQASLSLLCPAGHAGLPQVSLPVGTLDGCPVGLGVAAWPGGDTALLQLAQDAAPSLTPAAQYG